MKSLLPLLTVGAIAGIFLARYLEIESVLGKFGFALAGMAVVWGSFKFFSKGE